MHLPDVQFKLLELTLHKDVRGVGISTIRDVHGNTLIQSAILSKNNSSLALDAIKLLLKFQVDPLAVNNNGDDVLNMIDRDHPFYADILMIWLEHRVAELLRTDIVHKVASKSTTDVTDDETQGSQRQENREG